MSGSVKVCIRLRPFNRRLERESLTSGVYNIIDSPSPNAVRVKNPDSGKWTPNEKGYAFDYFFWSFDKSRPFADQQTVFDAVGRDMLDQALKNFSYTIFAYGQTGSGKSWSMTGNDEYPGVIPLVCREIFNIVANPPEDKAGYKMSVKVKYLEIYNEKVKDLLSDDDKPIEVKLQYRDPSNPKSGTKVVVEPLTICDVHNYDEIKSKLDEGLTNRTVGATKCNLESSRSHSVFTIIFTQVRPPTPEEQQLIESGRLTKEALLEACTMPSFLNLVDLAGSERQKATGAKGARLKEGCAINKSLSTLGRVISTLADHAMGKNLKMRVPYRESELTKILSDSLGGTAMTSMIAAISPANINFDETMSTLRYANNVKKIKNKPVRNISPEQQKISDLQDEVRLLREKLAQVGGLSDEELAAKREREKKEKEAMEAKYKEMIEEQKKQFEEELKKQRELASQTTVVRKKEEKEPYLTNLSKDDMFNMKVRNKLLEGEVKFGSNPDFDADEFCVHLQGVSVLPHHCSFVHRIADEAEAEALYKEHFEESDSNRIAELEEEGSIEGAAPPELSIRVPLSTHIVELVPKEGCESALYVNGASVTKNVILRLYDRIIIAGTYHTFVDPFARKLHMQRFEDAGVEFQPPEVDYYVAEREFARHNMKESKLSVAAAKEMEETKKRLEEMEQEVANRKKQEEELQKEREKLQKMSTEKAEKMKKELEKKEKEMAKRNEELQQQLEKEREAAGKRAKEISLLEEDLGRALPQVNEANMIASCVGKEFEIRPEIRTEYSAGGKDKRSDVVLVAHDSETGRDVQWDQDTFSQRLAMMRELYMTWQKDGSLPESIPKDDDPFYDPVEPQLIGRAQVILSFVSSMLPYRGQTPIITSNADTAGGLQVELIPFNAKATKGKVPTYTFDDMESLDVMTDDELDAYQEWLEPGTRVDVCIRIKSVVDLPEMTCKDVFCRYYPTSDFDYVETAHAVGQGRRAVLNHERIFTVPSISEELSQSFQETGGALLVEVWGSPVSKDAQVEKKVEVKGNPGEGKGTGTGKFDLEKSNNGEEEEEEDGCAAM
ncbi:Kinesin-like protein KIF13A [Aduncisulcus paluster]|uniref:Kinesin-like protein KIF13A n=1 Tax=Aduncisulcus paluster TaxID=2918883 RepID=A0ABQ5K958_9EUKA|nr:Kinesin-like protein KIF13A [Aduncisulcus paluster]